MILTISLVNANIDWKRKKSYVGYIVQPSFPGSWRCQRRLGSSQRASALAWEPSQRKQGQLPLRWRPSTLRSPVILGIGKYQHHINMKGSITCGWVHELLEFPLQRLSILQLQTSDLAKRSASEFVTIFNLLQYNKKKWYIIEACVKRRVHPSEIAKL